MQKVLTEEDERGDSETESNFSPSLKKKPLGELSDKFSTTLTEPGQQKAGNSPSFKRRKSPLLSQEL